jgi:flagellar hook-associated protein 2
VVVSQAAQQAVLTANTALDPTQFAGGGSFALTVDGLTSNTIAIPASTYTADTLVQALQSQLNADSKVGALGVVVGTQNGYLTFTTAAYGSGSGLSIAATPSLGFTGAASGTGKDAAGSFLVGGVPEAATGSGQLLTGNTDNPNTAGLAVNVTLSPSQVSPNPSTPVANVTVTQGLAAQLGTALNRLLDPTTGQLQTIDQNFQDQISAYQAQVKQLQQSYTNRQNQLTQEFANLETTLSNLKTTSSFLSAQTSALQSIGGSSSSSSTGH